MKKIKVVVLPDALASMPARPYFSVDDYFMFFENLGFLKNARTLSYGFKKWFFTTYSSDIKKDELLPWVLLLSGINNMYLMPNSEWRLKEFLPKKALISPQLHELSWAIDHLTYTDRYLRGTLHPGIKEQTELDRFFEFGLLTLNPVGYGSIQHP